MVQFNTLWSDDGRTAWKLFEKESCRKRVRYKPVRLNKMRRYFGFIVVLMLAAGSTGCMASSNDKSGRGENPNPDSEITYAEDMSKFNEMISGKQPVLVDFYADWCAPCRMMSPIIEKVAANMKGDLKVIKVNVDQNQEAAVKYGIRSIPTLMLFQNGEVKWQGVGVMQADQIEQIVKTKRE